jgi:hypothetical protein
MIFMVTPNNIGTNKAPLLIRNDYLRFLYTSMLTEFSSEEMREFWSKHTMRIDGIVLNEREFIEYVWDADNKADYDFVSNLLNTLEPFFISKQKSLSEFLDKYLCLTERGTHLVPKIALWSIQPVLKFLFKADDAVTVFLKYLHLVNERVRPGTLQKLVKLSTDNNMIRGDILFVPDPTFSHKLTYIDGELFCSKTLKLSMQKFGFVPIDTEMIAECQDILTRLNGFAEWQFYGDYLLISGEIHGKIMFFSEFLELRNINLPKDVGYPDKQVIVITKPFFCEIRKRTILYENCAYGAPVYIYQIIYSKQKYSDRHLEILSNEVMHGITIDNTKVCDLHKRLVCHLLSPIEIKFNTSNEYIFINERYVTQGKQALILLHILEAFVNENRTEFEHKEFIKDSRFISSLKQPGFVPRLDRISRLLKKACPSIRIEKTGKGRFSFKPSSLITLHLI